MSDKQTYYNTGKVKIGVYYAPELRRELTVSEERIQNAFIPKPIKEIDRFAEETAVLLPYCYAAILVCLAILYFS